MALYAIRSSPDAELLEDAEVVSESKYGWDSLEQAITLWKLVDPARANQIEAVMDRCASSPADGRPRFEAEDLRELVRLLSSVEDAIVAAGIVEPNNWRVPAERLEELARRVPAMDLKTERLLVNKTSALAEVMSNAISVRKFLEHAANADCVVVVA